jgi:uncharacterized membrane protein YeiH
MARDVLLAQVPTVLTSDLYAVAALAGGAVVVIAHVAELPPDPAVLAGAALCFALRVLAIRRGWRLPVAPSPREDVPPDKG